ncbi:PREDICTED: ventral anterior homeobox 2b-like [Branchiostoma belcheri]|uniref:Ventral anterior homeobox 2b-like n=1 Tax=Branchiostoma belcheri TaxID=7741 RepID=A0A6P4ZU23_BRABE|nr:PREDICTED: ventral anterior homeobox 2b-like [Branchiostoma belcheri]
MLATPCFSNTLSGSWGAQTQIARSPSALDRTDGTLRDAVTGVQGTSVTEVTLETRPFCSSHRDRDGLDAAGDTSKNKKVEMSSEQEGTTQNYRRILVKAPKGVVKEMVLPRALDIDRPKRARTAFTADQLKDLERAFRDSQYVVGQDRTELARQLGLTETQVKVWFQNRRTKYKREKAREAEKTQANSETLAALNIWKLLQTAPPSDVLPPVPTLARSPSEARDLGRREQPVGGSPCATRLEGNCVPVCTVTEGGWQPLVHRDIRPQAAIPPTWPNLSLFSRQNYDNVH